MEGLDKGIMVRIQTLGEEKIYGDGDSIAYYKPFIYTAPSKFQRLLRKIGVPRNLNKNRFFRAMFNLW